MIILTLYSHNNALKMYNVVVSFSGDGKLYDQYSKFTKSDKYINGLDEYELSINEHIPLKESTIFGHKSYQDGNRTQLNFVNLRPGSVVAVR